jgi:hypothetical protein
MAYNTEQLVFVSGSDVYYVEICNGKLEEKITTILDLEIAYLDVSSLNNNSTPTYKPNCMTTIAIEILDDDKFLGVEKSCNFLLDKRIGKNNFKIVYK